MAAKKTEQKTIQCAAIDIRHFTVYILGTTPFINNQLGNKGISELLFPKTKKVGNARSNSLKHNPYQEYLDSPYVAKEASSPALLQYLPTAFKKALAGAGSRLGSAAKTDLSQLCWCVGERISIYGIPQVLMSPTRSAGQDKVPDIRTRAILPKWALQLDVSFVFPKLTAEAVGSLISAAGIIQGVGDWRPEKGSGTYGQFKIVGKDDPEWNYLVKNCGRKAQLDAMLNPTFYDGESEKWYTWFYREIRERNKVELLAPPRLDIEEWQYDEDYWPKKLCVENTVG